MSSTCPICGGYLIYRPSYPILNGEEVKADLRCIHCGTSVIHFPHLPIKEKKGSGYSKKKPMKKICICGCEKEFIDRTANQTKKFFDHSHKSKYGNLINNPKRVRDDEDRMIEKIKAKIRREGLATIVETRLRPDWGKPLINPMKSKKLKGVMGKVRDKIFQTVDYSDSLAHAKVRK